MAPFTRSDMIRTANLALEPSGYRRKGLTWYLRDDETVRMFALDKSNFSARYMLMMAVNMARKDADLFPKYYAADWRGPLRVVRPDGVESIAEVDLDSPTPEDGIQRDSRGKPLSKYYCPTLDAFRGVIEQHAIPFLELLRTRAGILKLYNEGKLWPVPASLERALGLRE